MNNIEKKKIKGELIRIEFTGVEKFQRIISKFDNILIGKCRISNVL